ncbi:MAG: proton-conducting transporter membrane subunit [Planctomycetota bacterium]
MSELLILAGLVLAAISGLPGLFSRMFGQGLATLLMVAGACLGLAGVVVFWVSNAHQPIVFPWAIAGGQFDVAIDGLSALFLMPIFLISMLGSIYGLGYWKQTEHAENGCKLRLFYGLLTAGMTLLVIARNSILFLFGWEVMALSAFFLVITEDDRQEVRQTGWIYFVATHVATLSLFALFALLRAASGSFTFVALNTDSLTPGMATAIFVLAVVAFGFKAGMMPLHIWLPSAHAITPSHVSAIMSGVIIKMGIYGLVRITSLVPHPPLEWGCIVLGLGAVSGVLGVVFAIGQHDLKRLLAYHSIENIGIILIGVGLALIGRSFGRVEWVLLGLSGALLHVWNHALFKSLLFLSAGSVVHATGTREIDQLGGLAKRMPRTALCFLLGAAAICGLPPLNGFVSEFLIYLGLFSTLGIDHGASCVAVAFVAPALALIGALAVACFVKVLGAVFLGTARSECAQRPHEAGLTMIGPMGVLAGCCVFIGVAPACLLPILEKAVFAWAPELADAGPRMATLAPLGWISAMALLLIAALLVTGIALWLRLRTRIVESQPTWGCGYIAPTPAMQYTSSSFAQMLVSLFRWVLRPRVHPPEPLAIFPGKASFRSHVLDPVLDEAVLPAFRIAARLLSGFRVFQQGNIQTYLLYIFLALIGLLFWR